MSRRREAAELARVLLLSTQEATSAALVSPHTLSSSDRHTQESKEMELRACEPPLQAMLGDHGAGGAGGSGDVRTGLGRGVGMPPIVQSVDGPLAQPMEIPLAQSMEIPLAQPMELPVVQSMEPMPPPPLAESSVLSSSGNGGPDAVKATNTSTPTSLIRSFTSSDSSNPRKAIISLSTHQPSVPSRPDQGDLSSPFDPDAAHKAPNSSESSDRPLFSPTQRSSHIPVDPPRRTPVAGASVDSRRSAVVTYGRTSNDVDADNREPSSMSAPRSSSRNAHAVPSSPDLTPLRSTVRQSMQPIVVSSDNEVEEEIEAASPKRRATVQVVVPRRDRRSADNRHTSPDPLYGLIDKPDHASTSTRTARASLPNERASSASVPKTSQISSQGPGADGGPERRSSRVKESAEKKQAALEARRRERAERKAREAREAEEERKRERGETLPVEPGRRRDPPAMRSERRENGRNGGSMVLAEENVPPADDAPNARTHGTKGRAAETAPLSRPQTEAGSSVRDRDPYPPAEVERAARQKRRRGDDADADELDSWHGSEDEYALPVKKAKNKVKKAKNKVKDKKGKGRDKVRKAKPTARERARADAQVQDDNDDAPGPVEGEQDEAKAEDAKAAGAADLESTERETAIKPQTEPTRASLIPDETPPPQRSRSQSPVKPRLESGGAGTPLAVLGANTLAASHRPSPGPRLPSGSYVKPGGIQWKTPRNDLSAVLNKFNGARQSGMSKRHRIAPLHTKIGPPAKALPPVPLKPAKKKKGESEDEDEDEDGEGEGEGEDEGSTVEDDEGNLVPRGKRGKGIEWYMVED